MGAPLVAGGVTPSDAQPARQPSSHTAAYVIGGVGLAGLVTGVVAGLLVLDRKHTVDDNCHDHVCNQTGLDATSSGKTLGIVSTVGFVAGGVGLGAATYLFLAAPPPGENSRAGAYLVGIRAKW